MSHERFQGDGSAVSPVIGVVLMLALTVLLAATVGAFVLGTGNEKMQTAPPTSVVRFEYDDSSSGGDVLTIDHHAGERIRVEQAYVDVEGATCSSGNPNGQYWLDDDFGMSGYMSASDSVVIDGSVVCSGTLNLKSATVTLVWKSPSGATQPLASWP